MDVNRIRQDFPILKRQINGHPLIYFDNAATSQKPIQVIDAIVDFYQNHNANVSRAVHTLAREATEMQEQARGKIANFINARESKEVIFVRGTTEAINLVAYSLGLHNFKKDDEVLVSVMEHHSNIVPWDMLSQLVGVKIKYANVDASGSLDYDDLENKLSPRTKLVSLTQVSNVTGAVNGIKRVVDAAHDHGALMLVDGAQSVPHLPVDVRALDVDFLAFSGHKMLGPTGIGVLYGKEDVLASMSPFQGGGSMISSVSFDKERGSCDVSFNNLPVKFEAGTPDTAGIIGLAAAVDYLERLGMAQVSEHEKLLTDYAIKRLEEIKKVSIYGHSAGSQNTGIVSFGLQGLSSHDVALFLDDYGIAVRSGFHCAQPLHQAFKLQSSARASFYVYNSLEEIDEFVKVLSILA